MSKLSTFADTIFKQKYAYTDLNGKKETEWYELAERVASHVVLYNQSFHSQPLKNSMYNDIKNLITDFKFVPGGRYCYATGRDFHQTQNCLLLRAEDSREGWADLLHKVSMALMTGAGVGVDYSNVRPSGTVIKRTGGLATGPIALMKMVNECGRGIQQGGSRRSALWAGLRWNHKDIFEFIHLKDWPAHIVEAKKADFNAYAPMDGTNISILLDDEFFFAYYHANHALHSLAHKVYWEAIAQMLKTGEPGFSIDVGKNSGESLRNAPVHPNTKVLTSKGYEFVRDIISRPVSLWTGKQWANNCIFTCTKVDSELVEVNLSNGQSIKCSPEHPFIVTEYEGYGKNKKLIVKRIAANRLIKGMIVASDLPDYNNSTNDCDLGSYGKGYVYGDGSIRNGRGEISFHIESKKESFKTAVKGLNAHHITLDNRAYFKLPFKNKSDLFFESLNRSFIAGWFDADGSFTRNLLRLSCKDRDVLNILREYLDQLGIKSVVRQDGKSNYKIENNMFTLSILSCSLLKFKEVIPTIRLKINIDNTYKPYRKSEIRIKSTKHLNERSDVYCCNVGVEEHSFMAEGVLISNCTEITSHDDSDICNLGSINMSKIIDLGQMELVTKAATQFLFLGTTYSHVPYEKVDQVRTKNRRLGLGLMGLHEFLITHRMPYEVTPELKKYLEIYRLVSNNTASEMSKLTGLSCPVKTRAIAPTGTIGIIAETTTGIEPIFCVAYKRRYLEGSTWKFQYVIDPTAKRLIDSGVSPSDIEDAYTLANNVEKRVKFQADLQEFVDHGISSTINLPSWGSALNNESKVKSFGKMLIEYLPRLRGITVYPDGARGGQPLTPVPYQEAIEKVGEVFFESTDICDITKAGSCGS